MTTLIIGVVGGIFLGIAGALAWFAWQFRNFWG